MTADDQVDMARSQVFGEVAEAYDAARPGYADQLVTDVLAYAAPGGRPVVEVGAGTGKATLAFAARGVRMVCLEPDERMAAVLRRNTAGHPGVAVRTGGFEDWRPGGRRFGLLLAATSWHWVDPARRWDLAHAALAPGGALALVWNPQGVRDPQVHAALAESDRRLGITGAPHARRAWEFADVPGDWPGWPEAECRRDGRFTDLRPVRYRQEVHYDTDRYLTYLSTLSGYRVLPPALRSEVLAATARTLRRYGDALTMTLCTDVLLARAR
ncbi:class I SAM-dependent methyltransferase [Streptomyces sp. NPDC089919]|uniref:class I SAM-dependent methyltransferase n=1 Tax=Streptomyces sp. NPDC089919 TaxID=3155188 RepID=UPI003443E3AF